MRRSKLMCNGAIRVFRDGSVNRVKGGAEVPANIHYTGRGQAYKAVFADGKLVSIHRLVAMAFVPPYRGDCVNHINGQKYDNRAENLEWCTYSHNTQHAYDTGLIDLYKENRVCRVCGKDITDKRSEKSRFLCAGCEPVVMRTAKELVRENNMQDLSLELGECTKTEEKAKVFKKYQNRGLPLRAIGKAAGISGERVRQILEDYA